MPRRKMGGEAITAILPLLPRPFRQPDLSLQRLGAADDVEHDRLFLGDFFALQDVGDVLERSRFPDVHADQHVAGPNPLLPGRAALADVEYSQASVVARIELLEFAVVHGSELDPQRPPHPLVQTGLARLRDGSHRQLAGDRLVFAYGGDGQLFAGALAEEGELHVQGSFNLPSADLGDDVPRLQTRFLRRAVLLHARYRECPPIGLDDGLADDAV